MSLSVSAKSATWQLTRTLGQAIVAGSHASGNPFPTEDALTRSHELSRSVVREAVKILSAKGLLSSRPRVGITVRSAGEWNLLDPDVLEWISIAKLDHDFLVELLQMRRAVEPEACRLAALRGDKSAIALIGVAHDRMIAAASGGDDPLQSDVAFHRAILDASGNRMFAQFGNLVSAALRASIQFTNHSTGRKVGSIEDHGRVYLLIRDGDAASAHAAMIDLLDDAMTIIRDATRGDFSPS
jgi:DNA-binding FadR family transcriptional regulator